MFVPTVCLLGKKGIPKLCPEPTVYSLEKWCMGAGGSLKFSSGVLIFDISQTLCKLLAQDSGQFNINPTTFLLVMVYFVELSFWQVP